MTEAHAILAPSSAARWMQCGRSPSMEAAFPEEEESEAAREGTAAHWWWSEAMAGEILEQPARRFARIQPPGVVGDGGSRPRQAPFDGGGRAEPALAQEIADMREAREAAPVVGNEQRLPSLLRDSDWKVTALLGFRGGTVELVDIEPGDTTLRRVALLAAAALICGFFWEMWNFHSLARWIYAVPFVNRFHVFEMPILGYTGYLPFGIECALVGDAVRRWLRLF